MSEQSRLDDARSRIAELAAENERLRAALKKCADKLERCAIHAAGNDPQIAAIAVAEFRALTEA